MKWLKRLTLVGGPVAVTDAAAGKIHALLTEEQKNEAGSARVRYRAAGCSGFQYGFDDRGRFG